MDGHPGHEAARRAHWRATLRLTALLLVAWFGVTFVVGWYARELDFPVLGWPFSFWVASQGGLAVYVAIAWIHALRMEKLDAEFDVDEDT